MRVGVLPLFMSICIFTKGYYSGKAGEGQEKVGENVRQETARRRRRRTDPPQSAGGKIAAGGNFNLPRDIIQEKAK